MNFKKIAFLFFSLFMAFSSHKAAAGIPTIDVASLIQSTISAVQDIQAVINLYDQIDNQVKQIENWKEEFESITGQRYKDQLMNDWGHWNDRRWAPQKFSQVEDLFKAAHHARDSYRDMAQAGWRARDSYHIPEASVLYDDTDTDRARSWQQHELDGMHTVGVAAYSYDRVERIIHDTEVLIADLRNSEDQKASLDLLNRSQAQTQFLIAELIRLQSTQTATQGKAQLYQHSLRAEDRSKARFTELPPFLNH